MLKRMSVHRLVIALPLLVGSCIPVWRQTLLRPAGAVVVRDAATAAPIVGAQVLVRRYNIGPPPRKQSHAWPAVTDAAGRAHFTLLTGREWVMPLMMHGVPQWSFDVCVNAPGYAGRSMRWLTQGMWTGDEDRATQPDLELALSPGEGRCEDSASWQDFSSAPPRPVQPAPPT